MVRFKDMKKHHESLKNWLKNNGIVWCFAFSVLALGLSAYNTYAIHTGPVSKLPVAQKFDKLTNAEIEKFIKNGAPVLGNLDAKVSVVEFADFQCPFCGKYHQTIFPTLKEKYLDTGKVRFIYVDYAFLGQESLDAAEAGKCAAEQNKFWLYHDYLFQNQQGENQGAFDTANLKSFAGKLGLNTAQFNDCLDSHKYKKAVADEMTQGARFGVKGTPATFINDFFISGLQGLSYFENRIETVIHGN